MRIRNTVASPAAEAQPTFAELGLAPEILDQLQKLHFTTPTPIQHSAIPIAIDGEDIIGIAQTGTGKTLAFGLPMVQRFLENGGRGRGLVLLPTRELALQVDEELRKIGKPFGLRTTVLIGGAPMRPQQASLRANPNIIVATPGRLIDHLQSRSVDLRTVDTLVLDEADRMLDMGFAPQINQVLQQVPRDRQTMLFSATMPEQIVNITSSYMRQPTRVEIARPGAAADNVTHELFIVPQEEKNELLAELLYKYLGTILIFARTRSRAHRLAGFIKNAGHSAAEIHSDRSLTQRRAALDGFKAGSYRVLVATDIAARGIDVSDIELVLNYDLPNCAEDYVHRIGRTARAGKSGHAISFAAPDQATEMRDIEKLIRSNVPVSSESTHEFHPTALPNKNRPRLNQGSSPSRTGRPVPTRNSANSGRPAPSQFRESYRGSNQRDLPATDNPGRGNPNRGNPGRDNQGRSGSRTSQLLHPVRDLR